MPGTVALTGATGFIGSALRRRLLADGWQVRALAHRSAPVRDGTEWLQGDVRDDAAAERLVDGADAVIHCAGTVRGASAQAFEAINTGGTAALVHAAARHRPWPRFLLLSSLAAREPRLSWYAHSKRRAEDYLTDNADAMPWTILRPTAVYGPGDREMRPLFDAMNRGILPVPGRLDARITLLHVADLVAAIGCWLARPQPVRGLFELHDGTADGYGWGDIARIAGTALGHRVWRVPLPGFALYTVASVNLALARAFGYAPMLTPGKVQELRHPDWRCDIARYTEATGWRPSIRLADALRPGTDTCLAHHDC
ncbi:NAD-dependent epimerase/dehydratase family protein [Arhodomonas aquaeolei]|uniref:NAD-dependent epimerase/dehydratase family protein n=1 Tax=Arhodomonas aquaeolei TaxID=2369 RepID=UPI0003644314|nr:NAD(P)-dependent oxidoreductase [Arhodomonas aquaeolei]